MQQQDLTQSLIEQNPSQHTEQKKAIWGKISTQVPFATLPENEKQALKKLTEQMFDIAIQEQSKGFDAEINIELAVKKFQEDYSKTYKALCNYMWAAIKTDVLFLAFVAYQLLGLSEKIPYEWLRIIFLILTLGLGATANTYSDISVMDHIAQMDEIIKTIMSFFYMTWPEFLITIPLLATFVQSSWALALADIDGPVFFASLFGKDLSRTQMIAASAPLVFMGVTYYFGWVVKVMMEVCRDNFQYLLDTVGQRKSPITRNNIHWLTSESMFILATVVVRGAAGYYMPLEQLGGEERLNFGEGNELIVDVSWLSLATTAIVAYASRWQEASKYPEVHPHTAYHESLLEYKAIEGLQPKHLKSFYQNIARKVILRSFAWSFLTYLCANAFLQKNYPSLGNPWQDLLPALAAIAIFSLLAPMEFFVVKETPLAEAFKKIRVSIQESAKHAIAQEKASRLPDGSDRLRLINKIYKLNPGEDIENSPADEGENQQTETEIDPGLKAKKAAELTKAKLFNYTISTSQYMFCRFIFYSIFVAELLKIPLPEGTTAEGTRYVAALLVTFIVSDIEKQFANSSMDKASQAEIERKYASQDGTEPAQENRVCRMLTNCFATLNGSHNGLTTHSEATYNPLATAEADTPRSPSPISNGE